MKFETLDWQLESERAKLAFGIEGECGFQMFGAGMALMQGQTKFVPLPDNRIIQISRGVYNQWYCISGTRVRRGTILTDWVSVNLGHDGRVTGLRCEIFIPFAIFGLDMAKGLFCLGLLTPQVEEELKIPISSHQKLEWALEFEGRA